MDDDGIMLQIYDNIGDELKAKNKLLDKEKEKVIDFYALRLPVYTSHMSDTNRLVLPKKKARNLKFRIFLKKEEFYYQR